MLDQLLAVTLPFDSIVLRAIVAALFAVLLSHGLLRVRLRAARVRAAATAIVPAALFAVLLTGFGDPHLPTVLSTSSAVDGVVLGPDSAWLGSPSVLWLLGAWLLVSGTRVGLRFARLRRHRLRVLENSVPAPSRLREVVEHCAAAYRLSPPRTRIAASCPGGACVVGIRRQVLVIDATLLASLDERELKGVIAHELAHVRRRDNQLALLVGLIRDVFFFVPGGRSALRSLHTERELAADEQAVALTREPGALASGLLKVIEQGAARSCPAATLLPEGTLKRRVETLVLDLPAPSPARVAGETGLVLGAVALATIAAIVVPRVAPDDVPAVMFEYRPAPTATPVAGGTPSFTEAAAFAVYRDSEIAPPAVRPLTSSYLLDDDGADARCFAAHAACADQVIEPGLGLAPTIATTRRVVPTQIQRLEARAVLSNDDGGVGLYLLRRLGTR